MHLAVGGAVAKAATMKLAAMAFVVLASTTAAFCLLRFPPSPFAVTSPNPSKVETKETEMVVKAKEAIDSLETRAERLGAGLALAKEAAREVIEKRKLEKASDTEILFWPGCAFFPCSLNYQNSSKTGLS